MGTRALDNVHHESELGSWEMTRALPAPALRRLVRNYVGWWEHTSQPLVRRELPTDIIPLIVNFGSPVRISEAGHDRGWSDFGTFTTGVYDRFVLVGTSGPSGGLQIDFTILGARLFLGRPLGELMNRAVTLDDLIGSSAALLVEELHDAATWVARFNIMDRVLSERMASTRMPPAIVFRASRRLIDSGGAVPIASLVSEAGCSERHLVSLFREELGLSPKRLARVLRFGQAVNAIKNGKVHLSTLALDCGYYDHSHFDRDFKAFAGITPSELMRTRMPDGAGFSER